MRFLSVLLLFLSFLITTNAFGGSIEDQFSDVENLLDINQTKDALELLKKNRT